MASVYVLQSQREGAWQIESVYADRAAAIADAEQLHARAPSLNVRVVEGGGNAAVARVHAEFSATVSAKGANWASVAPLSGRRRDEIERHNEETRARRLFRQYILSRIREEHKRWDETLRMLTWRSALVAALGVLVVPLFAHFLG